ncbi:unnamed protein product [Brassica rapa]|uniref:Uncharacterized protein n=1 Tax=Brassica campestris TaxID=3711 RepID=A0A8D9GHB1_BRACM|nr:unnamed protein product [Brassica rapa]
MIKRLTYLSYILKHICLLSCSIKDKLLPHRTVYHIEYFQKLGLSCRRATPMFTRSTQLFNYSVAENYEPKVSYLVGEIGRDMREILESTQYFSFSLENWIKPRHEACLAKEVRFPLAVMMKTKRWV